MQRTDWAEEYAENLASRSLVRDWVFLRPKYLDRAVAKEVCDLIIALRDQAIVIEMKCQEDPSVWSGRKLENWIQKKVREDAHKLPGALKTIATRGFWCDHPRRGRVEFASGQLRVVHTVVMVENWGAPVDLPPEIPLECGGVRTSYFSTNDFLNLVNELHSFPDIVEYLDQRNHLRENVRRRIGREQAVFGQFLLSGHTFDHCVSLELIG